MTMREGIVPMEQELSSKELIDAANYLATELRIVLKGAPEMGHALIDRYLGDRFIGLVFDDSIAIVQQPIHFSRKGLFYTVHYQPPAYYTTYDMQRRNAAKNEKILIKIGRSDLETIIEHQQRLPDGNLEVHRNTTTAIDRVSEFIATF